VEENEPKEDARVPLNPARRRSGRSTRKLARLKAVSDSPRACFRPLRRCSARDKGNSKPKAPKTIPSRYGVIWGFLIWRKSTIF